MENATEVQADAPSLGLPLDRIGLVAGPLAMAAWYALGPPLENVESHRLAGVLLLLTIIWWLAEPIPIPATGLLSVVLCVLLGAVPQPADSASGFQPARIALAPFGDPTLFFLLGGMFIGQAMTRHGLDRRFALSILTTRWASRSPAAVLMAVGLSVMLVSMWISNTAATAMVYPVVLGIIGVLGTGSGADPAVFARSPYASMLLLMTAYASSVGGVATPIGTTTNVVAMGFFRRPEYFGHPADFGRWMLVGVPIMLILGIVLFLWLRWQAPAGKLNMHALADYLRTERARLGPWNRGEVNTLLVFLIVVGLWVTPAVLTAVGDEELQKSFSRHFPEEIVALLAPVLLFLLPVDWRRRKFSLEASDFRAIDWGTLLLFGSGLSLGNLLFKTGLAESLGRATVASLGTSDLWAITAVAIAGGIILSEFTSNAATATTLIPVVWAICRQVEIDPLAPLMGVTFGASFGSALPVSTPPNAIVYGSGLLPARRMVFAGIGVDIASGVVIWVCLRVAVELGWTPFLK